MSNENDGNKLQRDESSLSQNQDFLNHFFQSQYSSMSGTTEYTSDLFLDEELNNYQLARVRNKFDLISLIFAHVLKKTLLSLSYMICL
jgi:hypothetical protein